MSRIGKRPIPIPEGVSVEISAGLIKVRGPQGSLELRLPVGVEAVASPSEVRIHLQEGGSDSIYGLSRSLVANLVQGVSEGFQKELEIQGVGYRAQIQGSKLVLGLGYSHPIEYTPPEGIKVEVEKNLIRLSGADREKVGRSAAEVRDFRPPEPYKGKGIRYRGEQVRRKAGKAGKAAA